MTLTTKEIATNIFMQHIALATTDGRRFRSMVLDQMMKDMNCSISSAATRYNNVFKSIRISSPHLVEGLGRNSRPQGAVVHGQMCIVDPEEQDLNRVFSVIEIVDTGHRRTVGRTQCFIMQGDASELFDSRALNWPTSEWVLIAGMGPMHGESFKLRSYETEIRRSVPVGTVCMQDWEWVVNDTHVVIRAENQSEARAQLEEQYPGSNCWPVEVEAA